MNDEAPGAGSTVLDEAIAEFLRAEAAGRAGEAKQWLERFPACAAGLAEFFNDRQGVDGLMAPVRQDIQAYQAPQPAGPGMPLLSSRPNSADTLEAAAKTRAPAETMPLGPRPLGVKNTSQARFDPNQVPELTPTARYRPISFHARGGMGEIWLAQDQYLGRKVCFKKLRPGRHAQEARFVIEAQITGQLEHPNIVPLHDVGADEAGRPFYIMKFIQGRKLNDAIAEFHRHKSKRDWWESLEFRRLLETFVSICNVVAYAHNKGVLHRDIKPDNVMLGAYGETLVVDWGLAKAIGQPEEAAHSYVRLSGGESTVTQDGAIVGSPYYMSPEGAAGRPEALDQASDVYLLGGTLYEILTSKPPRQGSSSWELLHRARHSKPTAPRKVNPTIPRSLEAICMRAMAFDKEDRYTTPKALAEEIERFLGGAPTLAYQEPWLTRAIRWIRRHRRGILRGLAVLSVALIAAWAVQSNRRATALAIREDARKDLAEFNRLAEEAQFFAANADAVSERVPYYDPRRAGAVGDQALSIAGRWKESWPLEQEEDSFRQSQYALLLTLARVNVQPSEKEANPKRALALLDQAKSAQAPSRGYHQLRGRSLKLLGAHHAAAQEEDLATRSDASVAAEDYFLAGELLRLEDVGSSAQRIGSDDAPPPREHLEQAIDQYRAALRLQPRHYWARYQLGRCLLALGRGPEAVEALSGCIALRPDSPWAYASRGLASAISGHSEEAIADLDYAVKLDPKFQPARLNRGIAYWLQNNLEAAKADFDAVLSVDANERLTEAAFYRGQLLLKQGQDQQAAADFAALLEARPDFRPALWFAAKTSFRLGRFEKGAAELKRFAEVEQTSADQTLAEKQLVSGRTLRKMAQDLEGQPRQQLLDKAAAELQSALDAGPSTAEAWRHLGAVRELTQDIDEAIKCYSNGLDLSPQDVALRNMRGWAYVAARKYDAAREDFAQAVRLAPKSPESHAGLGFVLAEMNLADDAREEASIALLNGPQNHLVLHNVACIHGRLSEIDAARKIEHENLALEALAPRLGHFATESNRTRRE